MPAPASARLAAVLGVTALAAGLVYASLVATSMLGRPQPPAEFEVAGLLLAIAYGGVGCLVAARRPGSAIGWLLLYIALATATTHGADAWAQLHLPGWRVAAWLQSWTFYLAYPAAFSALLLLFPTGRPASGAWSWVLAVLPVSQLPRLLLAMLSGGAITGHMSGLPLPAASLFSIIPAGFAATTEGEMLEGISWALPAAAFAAACTSLAVRWRSATGEAREQLNWLALVAVLAALAFTLHFATDATLGPSVPDVGGAVLVLLLSAGVPGAIAVALLRHRLYEADRLINVALVYGALVAMLLAAYGVAAGLLDAFLQRQLQPLAAIVATGIVAVSFAPLRTRLQAVVSRLLFGVRADPYDALADVALQVVHGVDGRPLLGEVAASVARSLHVSHVAITAQPDGAQERVARGTFGDKTREVVRMPLSYRGRAVGFMELGPPRGLTAHLWHPRLLSDLAAQAAAASHAAIQAAEVQASRVRIVTVRDEERRRLRRDLHDGLGPALAAQTLKAGAARMALASNP